ncbi:GNAT family N-acetyltransferase [Chishuiella sp.]|uniref:GNAT family N-acetyltransferase n=1 Tax=Chishuiella sp. TaxID=1969467 RepID=UPI0028A79202|nr:GNAT family N-acetyltransferase [Chishuiella sp.]
MFDKLTLRKATQDDADRIWEILQQAILKRKEEGSTQWQEGYPNPNVINDDITKGIGYVVFHSENNSIIGYVVIMDDIEPAYNELSGGKWLTDGKYVVVHRLATAQDVKIKGLGTWVMQQVENVALSKNITSIKVDTNFDNDGMLRVFEKLNYIYCGEVFFRGGSRRAFEKLLV